MKAKTAKELRQELKAAEERERAELEAVLKTTPVLYRYFIAPDTGGTFNKIYDPTIVRYSLRRAIANEREAKEVGHSDQALRSGSMVYLYNTVTQLIIAPCGGGTSYVSVHWHSPNDGADDQAFKDIGLFLSQNPQGGDITSIVDEYLAVRALSKIKTKSGT